MVKTGVLSPGMQRYYRLRYMGYTRGILKIKKSRIHTVGRKLFYLHRCSHLDENNLCKVHNESKPKICKDLTIDTARDKKRGFIVTDNCLYKYKLKGGSNDGRKN